MLRPFLTLAVAATLLTPLAAFADAPAAPTAPATPAAPMPAAAPKHDRIGGTISAVDATAKTITITHHKKDTVVTVAPDAKIYKIGEKGKNGATGTFTDLTVGALVNVHTNGDLTTPTATEVHLRAPKGTAPAATPATP